MAVDPSSASGRTTAVMEALYEKHHAGANALAFMLTGDRELAEDLAQESFIRLMGRFRHLRDPGSFEFYLKRTVVNLCKSHFRRARLERAHARRQRPLGESSPVTTPMDDELLDALRGLPYRQRAAVVLRYFEDQSESETASTLGCSPRAVNALISRAIANLRGNVRREHE